MKELREIEEVGISVLNENKAKGVMNIMAPWTEAEKLNKNNRKYPLALLKREVNKVQGQISSGAMIGTGDHGTTGRADIKSASHIINKMWLDEAGKGYVEMKILGTERGKNIQEIIKAGGRLGLSSRGFGTVDNVTRIVKDDYVLTGIDIVCDPSSDIATFNKENIFESIDFPVEKKEAKMNTKSKEKIMETMYYRAVNANEFSGSFEDWQKKNEKFVDIAFCEVEEGLSYGEAVKKVLGFEKGQNALDKEKQIQPKVEIKDVYMEARVAGIDPAKYAEKINAEVDRQNEAILNDNDEQINYILREARSAGMNTADPEVKKKILENFAKQKNEPVKILTEKEKAKFKDQEEVRKYDYLVGEKMAAGYKGK